MSVRISCAQMKAMDAYSINVISIPSIVLMENAALQIIKNINSNTMFSFIIVCAPGNNGGYGLAITRNLLLNDKKVDVFVIGDLNKATIDFQINLTILLNMNVDCIHITDANCLNKLNTALNKNDLTIDAIFGIDLDRPVRGLFYQVIERMNQYSKRILAVDIPSGLDGDSGKILGVSIQAHQTVYFHQMKKGLVGKESYTGEVTIVNIGIPQSVTETILIQ